MSDVLTTIQGRAARWRDRAVGRFPWLRHIGWAEVILAACALVALFIANQFIELADDVQEGDTTRVDRLIVRALRSEHDPSVPIGPAWLRGVALDLTSLGSHAIIVLVVISISTLLAMKRKWRVLALVIAASIGAMILSATVKHVIGRDRPDVVPHFQEVSTYSFPSGHATLSAAVYLTLGAILAEVLSGRWTRAYCLSLAVVVVVTVGLTRVYLGVHYPTDVLGGWALGLFWALVCWAVAHYLKARGMLRDRASGAQKQQD